MQTYPFVDQAQFSLHVSSDFASSNNGEIIIPEKITLNNAYPNHLTQAQQLALNWLSR